MRVAVVAVVLALSGCAGGGHPPECAEETDCDDGETCDDGDCRLRTCGEHIESGEYRCDDTSAIVCLDSNAAELPLCRCNAGLANLEPDVPGCEDPTPEYERCCECLAEADSRYDGCLSTSVDQCTEALTLGATVGLDGYGCPADKCPAACAKVQCDGTSCTGY